MKKVTENQETENWKNLHLYLMFQFHILLGYVDENGNGDQDSNFVQITTAEFNDLLNARQELQDLKIALRILKNAMAFATNEEIEEKND
nr:hypothetical protein [Streptococcus parauberis]